MEWSFYSKKKKNQASLKFIIAKKIAFNGISQDNQDDEVRDVITVKIFTQDDELLLQGFFKNNRNDEKLEI